MRLTPQLTTTTALVALLAATPLYAQSKDSSAQWGASTNSTPLAG